MRVRDRVETILRAWNLHETNRGASPIIDYDCHLQTAEITPASSRLSVLGELSDLCRLSSEEGDDWIAATTAAHMAYLRALMGERWPLDHYIQETQGCPANGWAPEYVSNVGALAQRNLGELGIGWGPQAEADLEEVEGRLDPDIVPDMIRQAVVEFEPTVRKITASTAEYELSVESTNVDAYWSYWLDGAGSRARLRLNLRHAHFTNVRARQFALHEVLGHALQSASLAARCATDDVPWLRLLSVHAPHQVLLEGLAQALPLFAAAGDRALVARVRLDHYVQLVLAELHLAINSGATVDECATHAHARVPYWSDDRIADLLTDRGTNPLLRSYLWSYPAGLDWFVALADRGTTVSAQEALRAAYRDPLTPSDLEALWPAGPAIGGPQRDPAVRLRHPSLS